MAPDDRDRTFEKSLARHLRSGASRPDCLDAELLAAYHERLLAPERMISCKQHIASCARCQEILAQLEATDDLLIETETDQLEYVAQNVLTMPAPQETPELVPALSEPASTGPDTVPPRSARVAQSPWRSRTLHGANWRWLAPAGLLAAGLLIWISFHETAPSEFKLAKNTSPAVAPASPQNPSLPLSPAPRSSDTGMLNKEKAGEAASSKPAGNSAAGPATRADERATRQIPQTAEHKQNEREEALQSAMLDQKKSAPRSSGALAIPDDIPTEARARAERDVDQPNLSAAATSTYDASAAQDKLMREQAPPPAPTPPAIQKDDAVNAVAANAPPPQTEASSTAETIAGGRQTKKKAKSEIAAGAVQLQSAVVPDAATSPAMRMAKARASVTVVAPGSKVLWRIASAGLIEHSADAGATWAVQVTGVVADLLAGSAPSSQICWVVGRSGTILRTTDGGAHWTKIRAPVTDDLLTVFAVDDHQASVSITQASYQTMDGGRTWNKLLPE